VKTTPSHGGYRPHLKDPLAVESVKSVLYFLILLSNEETMDENHGHHQFSTPYLRMRSPALQNDSY
jgi:hypothetical protein